jgi:hypothetical protein
VLSFWNTLSRLIIQAKGIEVSIGFLFGILIKVNNTSKGTEVSMAFFLEYLSSLIQARELGIHQKFLLIKIFPTTPKAHSNTLKILS